MDDLVAGGYLSGVEHGAGVTVAEQEHVDEGDEDAGRGPGVAGVVGQPLVEHQHHQVAEQADHEHDLRDEAEVDVQGLVEVPGRVKRRHKFKLKFFISQMHDTTGKQSLTLLCSKLSLKGTLHPSVLSFVSLETKSYC